MKKEIEELKNTIHFMFFIAFLICSLYVSLLGYAERIHNETILNKINQDKAFKAKLEECREGDINRVIELYLCIPRKDGGVTLKPYENE